MDLYKSLGVEKQTIKASNNNNNSLESQIKKRINEVIHETLLKEYPQLYKNLDTTTIVKSKDGKLDKLHDISGYRLLIPVNESVSVENGKNKLTFKSCVKVSNPQIYLQGIKNNICEYVKIGGHTTIWNEDQKEFVEHKTK
jgi:hypothetical protein